MKSGNTYLVLELLNSTISLARLDKNGALDWSFHLKTPIQVFSHSTCILDSEDWIIPTVVTPFDPNYGILRINPTSGTSMIYPFEKSVFIGTASCKGNNFVAGSYYLDYFTTLAYIDN